MRVVVGLGSQPDLAVLVELVAWKAARPRLTSCQLGRTRGASGVASNGAGATAPVPPVSPRCTEEPLVVEPLRTAVSAEMAKSGHALHPAICRE